MPENLTSPVDKARPLPGSPSTFSLGTTASSKISSRVSLARQPIFSSFLEPAKPSVPFSTMNALMPFAPGSPVRAMTSTASASLPRVQNTFDPDKR